MGHALMTARPFATVRWSLVDAAEEFDLLGFSVRGVS
jgi:hypothetical protein